MTSVFVVDDHYMVIEGIRSLLQNEKNIEWMGHATTAASCLAYLRQQQPDIILMDINLKGSSGIDLCREVKTQYPDVFIIGLSSFNQQSYIQTMMDNGASGYLLKNADQKEICEAIARVATGKTYLGFDVAKTLAKGNTNEKPFLTRREKEVLLLIARGMTNNMIAEKLFISAATVDTHRKNLIAKFEVTNTAALIHLATQMQFI